MARKEQPKPLFSLRLDFQTSLENVCQQGIMLIQAVEIFLRHADPKAPGVDLLRERVKAFRASLTSSDEE